MTNDNTDTIHTGDAFDVLPELPANHAHAVVTDPPYGLAFMGRSWDDFEPKEYQAFCEDWATEVKRVLRPGGHLLAFSGNRTHHRLFSGVEDAGFEIRGTLTWHYGSGFPKALDVSKAIDKAAGVEPDEVTDAEGVGFMNSDDDGWNDTHNQIDMGEPTTDAAKKWNGWKTALKPATEFIVLARKPLSEGTVAENVQEWGTGALNIDGTRVDTAEGEESNWISGVPDDEKHKYGNNRPKGRDEPHDKGRYPANVIFDEIEAERLDREVGESISEGGSDASAFENGGMFAEEHNRDYEANPGYGDQGGPSRYFYTSKATKAERTEGGSIQNQHPTVKPTDLMEWLIKLVTAENQIVLDPFIGSGTTAKAAKNLNRRFIGIEKQPKWADVARARVGLTPHDPSNVRGDDAQHGLEMFAANGGHE